MSAVRMARWLFTASGLLLAAGCSGNTSSGAPTTQPAMGGAAVQIGPGGTPGVDDTANCNVAPALFAMSLGADATDVNGQLATDAGAGAQVSCTVHPDGQTFDVHAAISLAPGEGFSVEGQMSADAGSVRATFERSGVTYTSQGACAVDYSNGPDVAAGKVWATVMCPEATDGLGHTCFASAEFFFENCAE